MPLTAEEKNAIASGATLTANVAIAEAASLSILGGAGVGVVFLPLILGLQQQFNRVRFPQLRISDLGTAAQAAREGFRISADPFFGDVVISNRDQVEHLTELVRNAAIRRIAAEQDTSRLFLARRAVIEGLAETSQERGFAAAVDPSLRGGVFRETADSPLQFIEGDFLP